MFGVVWCGGKGKKEAASWCLGRKWLYTQIGALTLTPTHFDAHHDDDDNDGHDDYDDDDDDDGNVGDKSDNIVEIRLPTHR